MGILENPCGYSHPEVHGDYYSCIYIKSIHTTHIIWYLYLFFTHTHILECYPIYPVRYKYISLTVSYLMYISIYLSIYLSFQVVESDFAKNLAQMRVSESTAEVRQSDWHQEKNIDRIQRNWPSQLKVCTAYFVAWSFDSLCLYFYPLMRIVWIGFQRTLNLE